jgi:hypothetical protein
MYVFLSQLDSSDIATPDGKGLLFKIKSISCQIFDFSGLGAGSLPCEQILALIAAAAHSTDTPRISLLEMRGGNLAVVAAMGRSASLGRPQSPARHQ